VARRIPGFGVSDKTRGAYEDVVREHAREGWRLVQIRPPASLAAARRRPAGDA
jgi:hypothetical protein